LSNHVVTRVYRPPEIILTENEYGPKVDVWSLGCILVEILQCSDEYTVTSKSNHNRYLFKGTSCYPLSPQEDPEKVED
jgi:mitogen-activated protein kinase 1/3